MGKGTPAKGRRNKRTHIKCRRCGNQSYNMRKGFCSSCGYGRSKRLRQEGKTRRRTWPTPSKDLRIRKLVKVGT